MASSQRPTERMASRCTPVMARATLVFDIVGYSLHKGMGAGKFIRSPRTSVGGYEWCIRYYPDGDEGEDHVSVYLELLSKGARARALFDLRLLNQATGLSTSVTSCLKSPRVFDSVDTIKNKYAWGVHSFKKKSELENSPYLRDDHLIIECDLSVISNVPLVVETVDIQVPPSDLADNLGTWLETGEEADVTFIVRGESFPAHKILLAMRSPVFKAELYGPMGNRTARNITVEDMQPAVFKELLRFMYKDALPSVDNLDDDMVKHLLVAADRYAMERMKMICEGILCRSLRVETAATTLALADQHQCSRLKEACIEFIISSNRMAAVVASQGYAHLKRSCPAVLGDILESVTKSRTV
ncbi:BTB/POZ and MATH domain-containing protein 1-like [Triticum dicoccoides]|uniref:BTB/POZ and MATH domain-containing protein 1-like n=1 Tax=Triticum dicoccoides TaxID=85692 RepID=UPI000E78CB73|nr:BTB/POZ and MATH domain-containing protein 1-like [Triticum dicoccoides]